MSCFLLSPTALLEIFSDLSSFQTGRSTPHPFHNGEGEGHYVKLIRQILAKYICVCIKFLMYKKKFIVAIKACVHYLYFCHQNIIFKKSSKMLFIVPRKLLLSSRLFKLLYFPLHLFFPFIAIADFTEEVNWDIIMSLNWILKTQISGEVKF